MKTLQVHVDSAQSPTLLSSKCLWAQSSWSRMVGLLNHSKLEEEEALLIEPCKQVHSFFMRFAIDVAFLDKDDVVIATSSLHPWRMSRLYWKARKVLELPLGRLSKVGVKTGDKLNITEVTHV